MLPEDGQAGAPEARRPASMPARLWAGMVDGLAALGTFMIIVLMAMICADIAARNIIGGSLPLISELSALTLVMIVFLQLGTAVGHNRLARIEMLLVRVERRSPPVHAALSGLWDLIGAAVCAALAWSTYGILRGDLAHGSFIGVTGVLPLPTWPFRALILLGITVAAMQFLIRAVGEFRLVARPGARAT